MDAPAAGDVWESEESGKPGKWAEVGSAGGCGAARSGVGRRPGGRIGAVLEWVLVAAGVVLLAVTPRPPMMGDGLARYQALLELLEAGRSPEMAYSLIGPLFATPLWMVGRWFGDPQPVLAQYNMLLFGLGLVALYLLLRRRMAGRLLRRFLLLLVAGSMVAVHVQDFYGEMFTATTVGVGLLAATLPGTRRPTRLAGWVAVVLGVANTPASLVALGLVVLVRCVRERRLRYLSAPLAAGALIAGEAWLRFGDPLHRAYVNNGGGETVMPYSGRPGFSYPLLLGVLAIVFSFGKGLLWFTPGLFLPARRWLAERDGAGRAGVGAVWSSWLVFVAGLVLVYASWWAWYGGLYWGPRFFLIAILPASLAMAVRLGAAEAGPWANLATLAAVALSVWGAANSLVFAQLWPWTCYDDDYYLEALCHFTPEFSPLWFPFVRMPDVAGPHRAALAGYALVLLWLVAPLLGRLARQAGTAIGGRRPALTWRNWRW
ncbi:hypothetical protein [Plantactinospora endophytica]|uniref:DUF2029 domain-containing protein n=1 Tax=Plantactinospora endophytica TaxID=673535 RepID=A0ABQ4EAR8_9ACTN|nr:hypothetical protein [Plantactinospora endophytica]GIG91827.1 hypothetical protein Pen02_67630 [Plantactinospora endophytica]